MCPKQTLRHPLSLSLIRHPPSFSFSLVQADGIGQSGLAPVPEGLLKMAQRAAEEQKTMPDDPEKAGKPKIPASREPLHPPSLPPSLVIALSFLFHLELSSAHDSVRPQPVLWT